MGFVIIRKNGTLTEFWGADPDGATWDFFMGRMSPDVKWKPMHKPYSRPKVFITYEKAKWYLDTRAKRLSTKRKEDEKNWSYHIVKEEDYELDRSKAQ